MRKKTQIVYGLLLIFGVLLLSVTLMQGQAYARYHNTAFWNTVVGGASHPEIHMMNTPILTEREDTFWLELSDNMTAESEYTIEMLSPEQEFLPYTTGGLAVSIQDNMVIVRLEGTYVPAGTYRLVLTCDKEAAAVTEETDTTTELTEDTDPEQETGIMEETDHTEEPVGVETTAVTFFVNYSGT